VDRVRLVWIEEDRRTLADLMTALEITRKPVKPAASFRAQATPPGGHIRSRLLPQFLASADGGPTVNPEHVLDLTLARGCWRRCSRSESVPEQRAHTRLLGQAA
jgi:hypothetical protein